MIEPVYMAASLHQIKTQSVTLHMSHVFDCQPTRTKTQIGRFELEHSIEKYDFQPNPQPNFKYTTY